MQQYYFSCDMTPILLHLELFFLNYIFALSLSLVWMGIHYEK